MPSRFRETEDFGPVDSPELPSPQARDRKSTGPGIRGGPVIRTGNGDPPKLCGRLPDQARVSGPGMNAMTEEGRNDDDAG